MQNIKPCQNKVALFGFNNLPMLPCGSTLRGIKGDVQTVRCASCEREGDYSGPRETVNR